MIVFPHCKINIGLRILRKRPDGFHDLETIFCPLAINDALEVQSPGTLQFTSSGIAVPGKVEDNLCLKAWRLLKADFPDLPEVNIHLHKNIPIGAGLGGGSSDAAFMLKLLNEKFNLGLHTGRLTDYAAMLGSDCPFFIADRPVYATGRGEKMIEIVLEIYKYSLLLVYPGIHVNTGWAFSQITPQEPEISIMKGIPQPVSAWKDIMINDFEAPVFKAHPVLGQIKERLYDAGALYATMSGSGSTMVGVFPKNKIADLSWEAGYRVFTIM